MVGDTEVIATLTNIGTVAATDVTERMLDATLEKAKDAILVRCILPGTSTGGSHPGGSKWFG